MQTSMEPANGLNGSKHRKMATMLSIIPGVGQMYNKQFVKGLIFLVLTGSFIVAFADLLNMGLWGIVTLGTEVPRDHSVFLLVEGILALIVIAFGLGIYAFNLYDAYQNGKKRDIGTPLNSVKEQYRNLLDQGFPYLMVSPGFLLLRTRPRGSGICTEGSGRRGYAPLHSGGGDLRPAGYAADEMSRRCYRHRRILPGSGL